MKLKRYVLTLMATEGAILGTLALILWRVW
jgi:hypothetical protein